MHIASPQYRRLGALSVAAVAASLAMSSALASPAAADGPGVGTPTVVTVGDSLVAGEAGRWAGNTNKESWRVDALGASAYWNNYNVEPIPGCHRSRSAQIYIQGGVNGQNLACSGAKTGTPGTNEGQDFKPGLDFYSDAQGRKGQALALQEFARYRNVKAVVVTIGANNYGFEDVVKRCLANFLSSPAWAKNLCSDDADIAARFSPARIAQETNNVKSALLRVRDAMTNAGHQPGMYTILAQTYWSQLPRGAQIRYPEDGFTRQSVGGCGIWNRDADWANDVAIPALNTTIKNAAAQSGLSNIKVLDLQQALVGRRLCENTVGLLEEKGIPAWNAPGAMNQIEWVAQIRTLSTIGNSPYQVQESAHANYWGQLAMRNCLRQAYNGGSIRGGTCVRGADGVSATREPNMNLVQPTVALNVSLSCEPSGDYTVACDEQTSGGTAPYTIKWYIDGAYYGGHDNQQSIVEGCNSSRSTSTIKVVVSDANGAAGESTVAVACRGDAF